MDPWSEHWAHITVRGTGDCELQAARREGFLEVVCVGIISLCRKVRDLEASHWPKVWGSALEGKHLEAPLFQKALLG